MKCPFDWTDVVGFTPGSDASSTPVCEYHTGWISASFAGQVGNVGENTYRLARTTPTA